MDRTWPSWAPLPLRLALGIGFLYHGTSKLLSRQGHADFVQMLVDAGIPLPGVLSWVVAIVEVAGGMALLMGAFVLIATMPLLADMVVAAIAVHLPNGFNFMNVTGVGPAGPVFGMPGVEVSLVYMAGLLALALGGAGPVSIDALRAQRLAAPRRRPVPVEELAEREA